MGSIFTPYSNILQPTGHGGNKLLPILVVFHPGHTLLGKSLDAAPPDLFALISELTLAQDRKQRGFWFSTAHLLPYGYYFRNICHLLSHNDRSVGYTF
jgi:hypothetical protein